MYNEFVKRFELNSEYPSGLMHKMSKGKNKKGTMAGSKSHNYHNVSINRKNYSTHRIIVIMMDRNNEELLNSGYVVDHIDGNTHNNSPDNLRVVTPRENSQNLKRSREGQLVGAYKKGSRWEASCTIKGLYHYLGTFCTELEAHNAYVKALS